ncbi:MAG: hypothetical protein AB7Q27_20870 [Acidimicrobiia bacterium]
MLSTPPASMLVGAIPNGIVLIGDPGRPTTKEELFGVVSWFESYGIRATGELILSHDAYSRAKRLLRNNPIDEVIVAAPSMVWSRWLHLDLHHRIQRHFGGPVTTVR